MSSTRTRPTVFGAVARKTRIETPLRLIDVALHLGASPSFLSDIERGVRRPPSRLLEPWARLLGVSPVLFELAADVDRGECKLTGDTSRAIEERLEALVALADVDQMHSAAHRFAENTLENRERGQAVWGAMPERASEVKPVVDYNTCAYCERGAYFCRCAEPEVAKQMDAELKEVLAEIEAESRPALNVCPYGERHWAGNCGLCERDAVTKSLAATAMLAMDREDAMREVVEAARAWAAVSGHNMPNWGECVADPPEACKWLALNDSLARLDAQQQTHA